MYGSVALDLPIANGDDILSTPDLRESIVGVSGSLHASCYA